MADKVYVVAGYGVDGDGAPMTGTVSFRYRAADADDAYDGSATIITAIFSGSVDTRHSVAVLKEYDPLKDADTVENP